MEQVWQYLVITDLKATERSKNTHSSQNMSDLGKCRVGLHAVELLHLLVEVNHVDVGLEEFVSNFEATNP